MEDRNRQPHGVRRPRRMVAFRPAKRHPRAAEAAQWGCLAERPCGEQEAESQWRLAAHAGRIGTWEWHAEKWLVACSSLAMALLGKATGDYVGPPEPLIGQVLPEDREPLRQVAIRALADQSPFHGQCRVAWPDGSIHWLAVQGESLGNEAGRPVRILGVVHDFTESFRKTEELRASREQLRSLANSLQAAREAERMSLARRVHDVFSQDLSQLKLDIAWLQRRAGSPAGNVSPRPVLLRLAAMDRKVNEVMRAAQQTATELRPQVLDSLGLPGAIAWQAAQVQKCTGIRIAVAAKVDGLSLNPDVASALFRILQESLVNVVRHAEASHVDIRLAADGSDLNLSVQDNGRGIRPPELQAQTSVGLLGMQERARAFGGRVDITGQPGHGTLVLVRIPAMCGTAIEEGGR